MGKRKPGEMFPCVQNPICSNTHDYSTNSNYASTPDHYVSRMSPLNMKSNSSPTNKEKYLMSPFSESLEVRLATFKDCNYLIPDNVLHDVKECTNTIILRNYGDYSLIVSGRMLDVEHALMKLGKQCGVESKSLPYWSSYYMQTSGSSYTTGYQFVPAFLLDKVIQSDYLRELEEKYELAIEVMNQHFAIVQFQGHHRDIWNAQRDITIKFVNYVIPGYLFINAFRPSSISKLTLLEVFGYITTYAYFLVLIGDDVYRTVKVGDVDINFISLVKF